MTDKQTGGPAFPVEVLDKQRNGMTMRDYFAAKAMQGIQSRVNWSDSDVAARAYSLADAMLKARDGH